MLRRPADRLISFWHEFARIGWLKDLPSFVRHHLQKPAENHLLDTANQFARWGSVFGMRALHIEPMERALESSNTIVDHAFKEWLGLKDFTSAKQYAANKSLIEHTELIRAIGLMEAESDRSHRHAFAKCIVRYLKRHNTNALLASELIASKLVPFSLSDDEPLLREIEERGGHRFSPRPIQSWQYAPDGVFADRSIERLLLKLHKKAQRRIARRS
jgi:hypothetical protein